MIVGTSNGNVYIFASSDGNLEMDWLQPDRVTCVSGSSNSSFYAFGTSEGSVTALDLSTSFSIWEKDLSGEITDIDFNGKATHLVVGSKNNKLLLTNVTDGDEIWRTTTLDDVTSVSMS